MVSGSWALELYHFSLSLIDSSCLSQASTGFWMLSFFGCGFGSLHLWMRIWSEIWAMSNQQSFLIWLNQSISHYGRKVKKLPIKWFQEAYWILLLLWWKEKHCGAFGFGERLKKKIRTQLKNAKLMLSTVFECKNFTCCTSDSLYKFAWFHLLNCLTIISTSKVLSLQNSVWRLLSIGIP